MDEYTQDERDAAIAFLIDFADKALETNQLPYNRVQFLISLRVLGVTQEEALAAVDKVFDE